MKGFFIELEFPSYFTNIESNTDKKKQPVRVKNNNCQNSRVYSRLYIELKNLPYP